MANKLETELSLSGVEQAFREADEFRSRLEATENLLNSVGEGKPFLENVINRFIDANEQAEELTAKLSKQIRVNVDTGKLDSMSRSALKLTGDINKVTKELAAVRIAASVEEDPILLKKMEQDALFLEAQLLKIDKRLDSLAKKRALQDARPNVPTQVPTGSGDIGGVIGSLFTGGAVLYQAQQALQLAKSLSDADRVLASSAKEAGIEIKVAKEKVAEFGIQANLTADAAERTYSGILLLTKAAGQTQNIDRFTKAFTNLAAARGIESERLGDLARMLSTLQDEATDRLLGANPSQFYDAYAKSIGKTAAALTDAEKRAAVMNEVIRRGELFNGEAEKRIESLAGRMERVSNLLTTIKTKAGEVLGSGFLALADIFSGKAGAEIAKSTEEKIEIARGKQLRAAEIAKQNLETQLKLIKEIEEAKANPTRNARSYALSNVNVPTTVGSDPDAAKKLQDEVNAQLEKGKVGAEAYVKSFKDSLEKFKDNLGFLNILQKDLSKVGYQLTQEQRSELEASINSAVSSGAKKGFDKILQDANATVEVISKGLKDVQKSTQLNAADREQEIKAFEARLKQQNQSLIQLRDETRNFLLETQSKGNPLAKLMYDFETATERAEQRFKVFGKQFALQMAAMEKANISEKLNKSFFDIEQRALRVSQEITRLQALDRPQTQKSDLQAKLDRDLAEFRRTSNSTNPDTARYFERRQKEVDEFEGKQREAELEARRREVEQQVRLIQRSNLTTPEKTTELLNATQALSPEELGDSLRKVRIDALKQSVVDDRKQKQDAADTLKELQTFMKNFNKQLTEKGLKVDLSDQAVTNITVASKDLDAESQKKKAQEKVPSQADVKKQYDEYQAHI